MQNEDDPTKTEYLGAFNLTQDAVQAALTDFTLKNSEDLQEVVKTAEENEESVKVQVRWHTNNSFAELHLFKVPRDEVPVETLLTEDIGHTEEKNTVE